ncbi:MAG: hypothetical protein ACE5F3_01740 [Mariprofundaceae bacterium]
MRALPSISKITSAQLILVAAICFYACSAIAAPATMPYKGQLPDKEGVPVSGTVDLTFSLFQDVQGGLPVWTEIHLGVPVKKGRFKVMLGKNNPLNRLSSDRTYFVGVQQGLDPSAPELGARKLLIAAKPQPQPKAMRSATPAPTIAPAVSVPAAAPASAVAVSPTVSVAASSAGAVAAVERRLKKHMANVEAHHRQGPGSGLNADLLDGKDSTAFADVTAIESHTLDKKNPHAVTAVQTGAYTRAEVDALIAGLTKQIAELQAKLKHVSVKGTEMHITGANLHVESGSGSTEGETNGLGNVIIGYNETRGSGDKHTGSHNLVIGGKHNFSSYGGIVAGYENDIAGPYASISGGTRNQALGEFTSITGGRENVAQGANSAISGGIKLKTFGEDDWAAGGLFQTQ